MRFFEPRHRSVKRGTIEVYPMFMNHDVDDIMARGREFYAVWNEDTGLWSQNESDVVDIVDKELWAYADKLKEKTSDKITVLTMAEFSTKSWKTYRDYIKNLPMNYHQLDERITFANDKVTKKDYISKRLPYSVLDGDYSGWDELIGTLYSPDERKKIEWAIGAIVSGDSRKIQKFLVFYGAPGTGKGTVMNILSSMFDGYCATFNARALTSSSNAFALEAFRDNPLIGIQQDGDLSKIEDNTQLNSIVSHEAMTINEKYKSSYTTRVNCFLFLGSNNPVKITNAKSGIIRRLIDVSPASEKTNPIPAVRYESLMKKISFEYPAITKHCLDVYKELGRHYYDSYRPTEMIYKTDMFFNFVEDSYILFKNQDSTSLKAAYAMYKAYCEDSGAEFRLPMYKFREELKSYFSDFREVGRDKDGRQVRSLYSGFLSGKFRDGDGEVAGGGTVDEPERWIRLTCTKSLLDDELSSYKAQYTKDDGTPQYTWAKCRTTLKDIDTSKTHYVLAPSVLVTIDFDLKNEQGEKDIQMNLEAASKFPPTYAEFSNGGKGIHLEYWYDSDWTKLNTQYAPGIEIKVQSPNAKVDGFPLRRRVSLCNDIPVAHISSGLPLKEAKVIDWKGVKSEKGVRNAVEACLRKEHHGATKPEIDFIRKILDDAYASGLHYDISDMRPAVVNFAQHSSHQSDYCMKQCLAMKWRSEDSEEAVSAAPGDKPIIFFDCEVFPNLFLVNWKVQGEGQVIHRMINPGPSDMEELFSMKLVGFNCRRYDNHMLYGCYLGYSNEDLYNLSQQIIGKKSASAMFREAYNISYTDIYDFCSTKQSLKKWEIELGIHHQELGLPWDQPVPKEKWEMVAEYCDNDVIATEAVFNARQADWTARQILAALSGLSVNDTTNQHTTRIIFGTERNPQNSFNYRDMGDESAIAKRLHRIESMNGSFGEVDPMYTAFNAEGKPIFPGYSYGPKVETKKNGTTTTHMVSLYRGEEVGEGGYVYAEPGIYHNVALLDIASMHPSSIVAENLFGDVYTKHFADIRQARILIKHKDFDGARHIMNGKLAPFLNDEGKAKELAGALKIAINSVYGLTSAKFDNPFHDIRNKDNIVAKRGALFMVNLKHEVQARGFTVAHIKTDSIKIPDATPDIIDFVMNYGKLYGYNFEHEATYDRMCLVNDAVYVAKYKDGEWTATGAQFQQPYIFKTLFSHEPIVFDDLCETKSVTGGALYLDYGTEEAPEYHFVGRAGQFCPVLPGTGGGKLVREKDGKYYAATGTKGYLWQESELMRGTAQENNIDRGYYNQLVEDAVRDISMYGDAEEFML